MNRERLDELIDAYGADPVRWPAAERAAAQALLARTPDARTRLAEAAALDSRLDSWPGSVPALDPARLAAAASAVPQPRPLSRPRTAIRWTPFAWQGAAGLAAAALAGFLIGWSGLDTTLTAPTADNIDSVAMAIIEDATW
jgi:hypothetical protein